MVLERHRHCGRLQVNRVQMPTAVGNPIAPIGHGIYAQECHPSLQGLLTQMDVEVPEQLYEVLPPFQCRFEVGEASRRPAGLELQYTQIMVSVGVCWLDL